ncbi:MAG: hypothetical protein U0263_14645 [Polyangiaceae bacterium]
MRCSGGAANAKAEDHRRHHLGREARADFVVWTGCRGSTASSAAGRADPFDEGDPASAWWASSRRGKCSRFTSAGHLGGAAFGFAAAASAKRSPVYYQEFMLATKMRREYWEYKLEGYRAFRDARPNRAHLALVELGAAASSRRS